MAEIPHSDRVPRRVSCAVITVSDTRSPRTDRSGQLLQQQLLDAGHQVRLYEILPDEPAQIEARLDQLAQQPDLAVVIFSGGTGIAPRDTTYDAIATRLDKQLPGFGELLRFLSYQEIGSRAIASRATAGVYQGLLVFSLPGSTKAVQLAMERLILPELVHLTQLLESRA